MENSQKTADQALKFTENHSRHLDESAFLQDRSYVAAKEIKIVSDINQQLIGKRHKLTCNVVFHNYGKTPALISTMSARWSRPMPTDFPPKPQRHPNFIPALWMLGSDQSEEPATEFTELSEADFELIKSGTNSIWLVGWVEYKDVFDKAHITGLYETNITQNLTLCSLLSEMSLKSGRERSKDI